MVDSVAILPALSFLEQVDDLSNFLARALPETEKNEFLGSIRQLIESSAKTVTEQGEEGEETKQVIEEPTNEEKEQTISRIVGVITGGHPGLEGNDREIESQYLLLTTLIQSTKNAEQTLKSISDAVVRSASGSKKAEVACRILSNIYNLLSPSSSLRPQTLSSLFQLLTSNSTLELSYFPLTNAWLTSALSQWNISTSEKISWLSDVAEIYETKGSKKGDKEKGLELRTFALRTAVQDGKVEESKDLTKRALRALLAIPNKFDLEEVLSVKTARDGLTGEYKDLVELIESGELEQGLAWVAKNGDFLSGESLKADQIVRKLRLLALTTLAAQSATKEISYAEIANALKLDEDDIEISVIDAIHSGLMKASLSQPTKTLRVQSVQARSFGSAEWQLLDKRLGEWKTVLEDVQKVIQDAIIVNEQSAKDVRGGYKKGPRKPNNAKPEESKTDESADRTQVAASA